MNTQTAVAFWLTEEKPDKTRRRRSCLGCGETQEYLTKEPAPSYVAWFKAHQPCRELYSQMEVEAASSAADEAAPTESLPECPGCGFVGVYLTPTGKCMECAGVPAEEQDGLEGRQLQPDQEAAADCDPNTACDPKIAAFMERTGCTREEVQAMIDKGQITLRGPAVGTLVTGEKVELLAVEHDNKHVVVCDQSDDPDLLAHELPIRRVSLVDVRPLNRAGDPCDITTTVGPLFKKGLTTPSQRRKTTEKKAIPEKKAITA